jgi:multidrug resistance efflux pump
MHKLGLKKFSPLVLFFGLISISINSCKKQNQHSVFDEKTTFSKQDINTVSGFGRIEPNRDMIQLSSEVDGIVIKKMADEGDTLLKGDTILILNHNVQKYKVRQLEAEVNTQKLAIKSFENQVKEAHIVLRNKQTFYKRISGAFKGNAESRQNVDDARLSFEQAKYKYQQLSDRLLSEKSKLIEIKAGFGQAKVELSKRFITALSNGTILNLKIVEGSFVSAFTSFGEMAPAGPLCIKAEVDELFAQKVKSGQQASITLYGQNDTVATGHITYVAPALSKKSIFSDEPSNFEDRRVRKITISLTSRKPLIIGSRVNAFIKVK